MATQVHPESPPAAATRDAKHPVTVLAGPYGHPFHPILVTVPIGCWVASFAFDLATRVGDGSPGLVLGSFWLIGLGILGALGAAVFGLLDLLAIPRRTLAMRTGLFHLGLNVGAVGLYAVNFLWRRGDYDVLAEVETGQLILSAGSLAVVGLAGWLGGKLAYRYGVRVAHEVTQAEGFVQR